MPSQYPANFPQTQNYPEDEESGADSTSRLRWKGPQDLASDEPPVAPASPGPNAGTSAASGAEVDRPRRASILKKPGASTAAPKEQKRASISLGNIEPRKSSLPTASSSGATSARSMNSPMPSSAGGPPSGRSSPTDAAASISTAAAAAVPAPTKPANRTRTMDLGFFGKKPKAETSIRSNSTHSMQSAPAKRERRTVSLGVGFLRTRSGQQSSAADWSRSESEAESAPNARPMGPTGSHQGHRSSASLASVGSTGAASRGGATSSTAAASSNVSSSSRCCRTCFCPQLPKPVTDWINQRLINTKAWNAFTIFFTIVLLFGTQIQDLWCPPSSDVAFDVIFTCSFVFLMLDVILRSAADPSYFIFNLCGRDLRSPNGERSSNRADALCGFRAIFEIGSFMFWCDMLSTLSLLWDISYIGSFRTAMPIVEIEIDEIGVPIKGTGMLNESSPIQIMDALVIEVIIAILRTLRVSRFIKTSAVVETSSKVNWYWLPDRLNPSFWLHKCCDKGKKNSQVGGGILSELSDSAPMELDSTTRRMSSIRTFDPRRSSFSSVGSDMYEEGGGVGSAVNNFLLMFGVQNRRIKEFERQNAATKIQRAWREYCEVTGKNARRRNNAAVVSKKASKLESAKKIVLRNRSSTASAVPVDAEAKQGSQVGSAMRELTGQRVAIGIVIALVLTVLFTYSEINSTNASTMIVLHEQTQDAAFKTASLDAARQSTVPDLFSYEDANGDVTNYTLSDGTNPWSLRPREVVNITIVDPENMTTIGLFDSRQMKHDSALVELIDTIFILMIWFFGVTAFAGPVMILVVTPIERMIRLLSMLMKDPLGFQGTSRYKKFVAEEDKYTKNTKWTKDVLKGMETSFLMSTILRIGSLMKVGFGAAGVEIIRNNLAKGESKDGLVLNTQGTTVQCIFLFCDIRQFTDATECLQEEVFVFTNKIASVIHSICNSYGGSANKNVGDAFLMSWLLSDENSDEGGRRRRRGSGVRNLRGRNRLTRSQIKADSAMLAVVKISISLYYDKFFLEDMTDAKQGRLMKKIAKRMGPVVQMGFGLHCGKAVQGAIGTQRKLDATYVSDAVEFAEFLESSTKQFGVKMLLSNAFHDLLSPQAKRRCRKVDQILILDDDMDPDDPDLVEIAEKKELYTFDMDIDELWRHRARVRANAARFGPLDDGTNHSMGFTSHSMGMSDHPSDMRPGLSGSKKSKRDILGKMGANMPHVNHAEGTASSPPPPPPRQMGRRRTSLLRPRQNMTSLTGSSLLGGDGSGLANQVLAGEIDYGLNERGVPINMPQLTLPSGTTRYSLSSWSTEDMRIIRKKYSDGLFFQQFNTALQAYYSGDWKAAGETFSVILERFEDGPSRCFMGQIEAHDGTPPRKFLGYNVV